MLQPKPYLCARCGARAISHNRPDRCSECGETGCVSPEADVALGVALRLTGEERIEGRNLRARQIALEALRVIHPDIPNSEIAAQLRYPSADVAKSALNNAKRAKWWADVMVDEVIGTLVARQYGERAA